MKRHHVKYHDWFYGINVPVVRMTFECFETQRLNCLDVRKSRDESDERKGRLKERKGRLKERKK